jgi:hypothetical protein
MLPLLASPLAYFFFPAFFGRCVTWPRLVWRLPVALGPLAQAATAGIFHADLFNVLELLQQGTERM